MSQAESTVKPSRYNVPNLERGLKILEHLLEYPAGLKQSELALQLGYSKTSVFRITMTLIEYGFLSRNEETKALVLTRKLLAMGNRALVEMDLMTTSIDALNQLRDVVNETVLIGALADQDFLVLGQVLGSYPFKFSLDIGSRLPLHTSAPAKAILAFLPEGERSRIVSGIEFIRYTENTIVSSEHFQAELERIKANGFALDLGEQLTGILCVAAPIFNRFQYPIAALWTTGPSDRLKMEDLPRVSRAVMNHAALISARLRCGLVNETANLPKDNA